VRIRRLGLLGVLVSVLLGVGVRAGDAARAGGSPSLPFPVTDGIATNSALAGSTLYLGGTFSRLGTATGTFASLSASSGHAAVLPHANDSVLQVVSDRRGGWFISGDFTAVGAFSRAGLAHIEANGTVDPRFHPKVSQPYGLAVSPDGSTLYVHGDPQDGGASYLDAVDTATGAIRSRFRTMDNIRQLIFAPNGTLWASGVFGKGPGVEAINPTSGKAVHWLGAAGQDESIALSPNGATVYALHGGDGDQPVWKGHLTAWSTVSYKTMWERTLTTDGPSFSNSFNLVVSADGRTLYAGGEFTRIDSQRRAHLAAFRAADGSLTAFNLGTAGSIYGAGHPDVVYALAVFKSTLYVGGAFTSLGGVSRYGLGSINTVTGTVTGWAPEPNSVVVSLAVGPHGNAVGAGGGFTAMGSISRDRLAAINLNTDAVTAFAPDFGNGYHIDAMVLSPDHATLYVGGAFTTADGANRNGVAAFSTADGALTSFSPAGAVGAQALAISPDGSTLYIADDAHHLVAVSTATGATIWSVSAGNWWDSSLVVSPDGSTIYASQINATPALSALATATGAPVPGFHPPAIDTGGTGALAISPDGSTVYSGTVGFDATTGTPTFKPNVVGAAATTALSADGSDLFIAGILRSVNGVARSGVAEINVSNGHVTAFDPHFTSVGGGVEMVALHGSTLIAGGDFGVAGLGRLNLARFAIPSPLHRARTRVRAIKRVDDRLS